MNEDYQAFVDKFKPKLTTDDCYTPEPVMTAVLEYCRERYDIEDAEIIRPFWPGGDYTAVNYPDNCVVIDNPPFSILAQIISYYIQRGIRFFLFAPSLTLFSATFKKKCTSLCCWVDITYENGAVVRTSFVTNMEPGTRLRVAPTLYRAIKEAQKSEAKSMPVYTYPDNVVTAARLGQLARYGVEFVLKDCESYYIRSLASQKDEKKTIFGSGLLISDNALIRLQEKEKEKEKKKPKHVWKLSDEELEIINKLQ